MDNQSIQHTRWNCTYHIVYIPKYRRKIMYGEVKKDIRDIIKKLCEMKGVQIIEGKVCIDHVHIYVAIPPKLSVSDFMSYLKRKECADDIRQTSRIPCKTWRQTFLGERILCCNGRERERRNNQGIH